MKKKMMMIMLMVLQLQQMLMRSRRRRRRTAPPNMANNMSCRATNSILGACMCYEYYPRVFRSAWIDIEAIHLQACARNRLYSPKGSMYHYSRHLSL